MVRGYEVCSMGWKPVCDLLKWTVDFLLSRELCLYFTPLQIVFFLLGWSVMKRMKYFKALLNHEEATPVTLALICPGVAFVVITHRKRRRNGFGWM